MSIAIVVDSKHGSTEQIGAHLAEALRDRGQKADVFSPDDAPPLYEREAVIIGSGVYAGNWLPGARSFLEQRADELRQLPVWLFSSGPLGEMADERAIKATTVDGLIAETGARGHQLFPGKLDKANLSRAERLIVRVVHAPEGDFRDFDAVSAWADEIVGSLGGGQESGEVTTRFLPRGRRP